MSFRAILDGKDVITIAPTGSGKSLTYWMPLLFIKYGITVSAVSITVANATNELFEASLLILFTHSVDSIY